MGAVTSFTSAVANATVVVPYRLVYEAPQDCPDERALRNTIAERIGREPFVADDPKTLSIRIEHVGRGFRATITTTNSEGSSRRRTLESPVNRCGEIFKDVDFVVGTIVEPILIDMPAPEEQSNTPDPAPPSLPPPPAPPPPSASPPPPLATPMRRSDVTGEVYGGLAAALLATPGPVSLGGIIGGGVKIGTLSVNAEARGLADIPGATAAIPVGVSLWTGAVGSCISRTFSFCATFTLGAQRFSEYQGVQPRQRKALFAAPGLRVAYDSPAWHGVFARTQIDVSVPFTESTIRARDVVLWESWPVLVSGALLLATHF